MSDPIRDAVQEAVIRAKCDRAVLVVGRTARHIAAAQGTVGDDGIHEIARAIMGEAARRGVAMQFTQ